MEGTGLNTRDLVTLLLSDAKRRPDIRALVDRIDEMTTEDINAAVVPLKWYRDALHLLKARGDNAAALTRAAALVEAMGPIVVKPEITGEAFRALEEKTIDNRGLSLVVKSGDLLFHDGTMLWLGSFPILNQTQIRMTSLGQMTRDVFAGMVLSEPRDCPPAPLEIGERKGIRFR